MAETITIPVWAAAGYASLGFVAGVVLIDVSLRLRRLSKRYELLSRLHADLSNEYSDRFGRWLVEARPEGAGRGG